MRVWLVTFSLLFVLVEMFQWAKGFFLPLPIYVLGGAVLAIASNYDKGTSFLLSQNSKPNGIISQTATLVEPNEIQGNTQTSLAILEIDQEIETSEQNNE